MGKKKVLIEQLSEKDVEAEIEEMVEPQITEADARNFVFMLCGDVVRGVLNILDEEDWKKKLKEAKEVRDAAEQLLEEVQAFAGDAEDVDELNMVEEAVEPIVEG